MSHELHYNNVDMNYIELYLNSLSPNYVRCLELQLPEILWEALLQGIEIDCCLWLRDGVTWLSNQCPAQRRSDGGQSGGLMDG